MDFLTALINGLSSGGTYAIIALGYTMVYGIAKMLNFAHGDIIMIGGCVMYSVLSAKGNPLLAILAAVVFCVVLGVTIEKLAYKPLRGAASLAVLITAISMSYLLQSVAQIYLKSGTPALSALRLEGSVNIGSFRIDYSTILTLAVTIVVMVALSLFVKYSKTGRAMVAVSEDRDAALLMGINTNFIITITFAIGSALAAIAGYLMLCKAPILTNTLGSMPGIKAFAAAVIGGIGSIPGAMLGGILLGVVESISYSIPVLAPFTEAVEFSILIIILLVRPSGILGKMRREKV
ncbi:MAG: branched-chain amino acid ABC transporter permease [Clostridia bacterium]|nr:branched-chain amino acid ABC transporter permease [Clostridia bacterium]